MLNYLGTTKHTKNTKSRLRGAESQKPKAESNGIVVSKRLAMSHRREP
jgi:hypothetical protein